MARIAYTIQDDMKILRCIIDHNLWYAVRGKNIWRFIVKEAGIYRTWQSAENRFRRYISTNIRHPGYSLTTEEREKFEVSFYQLKVLLDQKKDTQLRKAPKSRKHKDDMEFSEDEIESD